MQNRAAIAVLKEAIKVGWPRLWVNDLARQLLRLMCADYADDCDPCFAWSVRECGADLYPIADYNALDWCRTVARHEAGGMPRKHYIYKDHVLQSCSAHEQVEFLLGYVQCYSAEDRPLVGTTAWHDRNDQMYAQDKSEDID